jgi:CBS domain-containing protein
MEINEIMQRDVAALDPSSSLLDAVDLMHERGIRHVPLVQANGEVVGIISDRDVRCYMSDIFTELEAQTAGAFKKTFPLRQIMQAKPLSVDPSADVLDVLDIILENKVGAVIVTDSRGRMQGIVSYEDLLKLLRDEYLTAD